MPEPTSTSPPRPTARKRCTVSDLEPAVAWVRKNHPSIKITVYIPTLPNEASQRRNDYYQSLQVNCRPLPLAEIPQHLLPVRVTLPNGSAVERPPLA